jgi:hypothetical protein
LRGLDTADRGDRAEYRGEPTEETEITETEITETERTEDTGRDQHGGAETRRG